jgi:acyl-CoA dehydrogenase
MISDTLVSINAPEQGTAMPAYSAPLDDMTFVLRHLAGLARIQQLDAFSMASDDVVEQVLEEASKFARDIWAPLNESGDTTGCRVENNAVIVPDGFAEAYRQFVENGWQSIEYSPDYGGMGLPGLIASAAAEMFQSANLAFSLCPMLTGSAIYAVESHASEELKKTFLPKLVSGEWTGTMNLTEPQAGSDLAAIKTRAVPENGHYRLYGTKIFITWGDQPFSENILHMVLARLPDAPPGVRGISMFLVPKFLVNDDGSIGERNDVFATSVEHKMGIHASPTCVLNFGDKDGAIAYLVGEENKGLACMFTMMNHARIGVGIQGLAISDRAYQLAREFARQRIQGVAPGEKNRSAIVQHPDVRRMLMVMKSQIEAMRAVAYVTAGTMDIAHHETDVKLRNDANERVALLTPIVKGWMTEVAQELTSIGVQVHGGMGYVEETGAAQHMRDARILTIYEGTTGIQANDLIGRKILGDEGRAVASLVREIRELDSQLATANGSLDDVRVALANAATTMEETVSWLVRNAPSDPLLPGAAAFNTLMLMGTVVGGWQMARAAAVCQGQSGNGVDENFCRAKLATADFYFEHIMPRANAYARAASAGSHSTMGLPADLL